jgi:hypothetical protein
MRVETPLQYAAVEHGWAEQTRRVLTRDLLVRAACAQPAERQALLFRALHLNLSLVGTVADGFGLTTSQCCQVEHGALEALAHALRSFDPFRDEDFADFAVPVVEQQIVAQLPMVSARTGRASRR